MPTFLKISGVALTFAMAQMLYAAGAGGGAGGAGGAGGGASGGGGSGSAGGATGGSSSGGIGAGANNTGGSTSGGIGSGANNTGGSSFGTRSSATGSTFGTASPAGTGSSSLNNSGSVNSGGANTNLGAGSTQTGNTTFGSTSGINAGTTNLGSPNLGNSTNSGARTAGELGNSPNNSTLTGGQAGSISLDRNATTNPTNPTIGINGRPNVNGAGIGAGEPADAARNLSSQVGADGRPLNGNNNGNGARTDSTNGSTLNINGDNVRLESNLLKNNTGNQSNQNNPAANEWRWKWYNNAWWYWMPSNHWLVHQNGRWDNPVNVGYVVTNASTGNSPPNTSNSNRTFYRGDTESQSNSGGNASRGATMPNTAAEAATGASSNRTSENNASKSDDPPAAFKPLTVPQNRYNNEPVR